MKDITELHHRAMDLAEQADLARIRGDIRTATRLLIEALCAEKEAASLCPPELEPTRSVLYRSAASLALQCDRHRDAEQLISMGLSGDSHPEIADELRDLMEQVWFERHLAIRGKKLDAREIQLSISGSAVGFGMIVSEEFIGRAQALERMIYRTAERRLNLPYRDNVGPNNAVREKLDIFYAPPKAASFAITMRVGRPVEQGSLFPNEADNIEAVDVIDEVVNAFSSISEGKMTDVLAAIPDESYRRNFMALARKIGPNGSNVSLVGLTVIRNNQSRKVKITQPIAKQPRRIGPGENGQLAPVTGYLKYADDRPSKTRKEICVVDDKQNETRFVVPEGMMSDIVQPLWDKYVIVEGHKKGKLTLLDDIRIAPA